MITVFIGQRGTGKSSLLKRITRYCERLKLNALCYDLDAEIEKRSGQNIAEIFSQEGETAFRLLEKKYFQQLLHEASSDLTYIVVGGGFDPQLIPPSVRVIWLQRVSDQSGRIFLDRPSLNPDLSPLQEYHLRLSERVSRFGEAAWEEYLIPEGLKNESSVEAQILIENPEGIGGCLTLMPWVFIDEARWKYFIQRRLRWGFDYFEIRDDLLSEKQIQWALRDIPAEKILWARRAKHPPDCFSPTTVALVDYDRAFAGEMVNDHQSLLSIHERRAGETLTSLFESLKPLEERGVLIKFAPVISNFEELQQVHRWQQERPSQRSFLPRSDSGRWLWYRLLQGRSQQINFLREGEGSSTDQPSLYQWLMRLQNPNSQFAALLGDPVSHSYTPVVQGEFFQRYHISVLPIQISKEEFDGALPFLESLGLVAAAVTSPLKLAAYQSTHHRTPVAESFKSVNTLFKKKGRGWIGDNTDEEGLAALVQKAQSLWALENFTTVAVWGGGGTLPLLEKHFPGAKFFSIQSGQLRSGTLDSHWRPEWVVWAAGRMDSHGTLRPPEHWCPRLVVDLNYRDDSGGLELAKRTGASYLDGELMFQVQAEYQQRFWEPLLADL